MNENIQDLTDDEIKEQLLNLRANRKKEYTQPQRKKTRPAELAVDSGAADKLIKKMQEAGGLDALLEQEGLSNGKKD